jgi:hypothetical protein
MSTLKVDKIEPFSGGQVEITGLNVTGFASTGSNAFDGNQTITGSLTISSSTEFDVDVTGRIKIQGPSTGQTPQLIISGSDANTTFGRFSITQKLGGWTSDIRNNGSGGSYINFYKDDFTEDVTFINKTNTFASNGTDGPGFVLFNGVDYDATLQFKSAANWGDGTTTFNVPLDIKGGLTVSSSREFDVDVTGRMKIQGPTTGQTPKLTVSGSDGRAEYERNLMAIYNSSGVKKAQLASLGLNINLAGAFVSDFVSTDAGGAYWNFYSSSFDSDVTISSKTNLWSTQGNNSPGISMWNGSEYVVPIQFRDGTNWGDGTMTFNVPLDISGSLRVSESVNISQVLTLKPLDPLPSADTGSLAVSGSNLYYYDGTIWSQIN